MKIIDGHVHVLKRYSTSQHERGRIAALAIILGYWTTDGAKTKRPRPNCCALMQRKIPESSRPRSAKMREMLAKLPSMSQDQIKKLLDKRRKAMKRGS